LREHGFWFFSVLALWIYLRWQRQGGWQLATFAVIAIGAAMLFRVEALLIFIALSLCLLPLLSSRQGWIKFLQLHAVPALIVLLVFVVLWSANYINKARFDYFLGMLDPQSIAADFEAIARQFSDSLKNKYSKDEAGQIVFFGALALILIQFVKLLGPFSLPFLSRVSWGSMNDYWREFQAFGLCCMLYLVVLMIFFFNQQFMNSRYVSFLGVLVVPLLSLVMFEFGRRHSRLAKVIIFVAILFMLDNVVSLSAKKTHYIEAAEWLSTHVPRSEPIYYDDQRIAYYAGRGYKLDETSRKKAMSQRFVHDYRYFVIEADVDEHWVQDWLIKNKRRIIADFSNAKGDTVLVIGD
jgi:4-amino-4-deoxy-L-arabinose transferase-like glycosyltransferase